MKPSLLPCGCDDGTCDGCKAIQALNEAIEKTSAVYRDKQGNVVAIINTRTEMQLRRLLKGK